MKPFIQLLFRVIVPALMGTAFAGFSRMLIGATTARSVGHFDIGAKPGILGAAPA
jgi:hypothetical protein